MKKFNKKIGILLSSSMLLAAAAVSQNTKDMTFSSSKVPTDSVPEPTTPKYEFGIGGGIVVYQGDLAPTKWGAYRSPMPGVQAHFTRLFSPAFALRIGATVGQFKADDVKSAFKQSYRDYRKYNFTTSFAELSALAQWTPFAKSNWRLNPYLMGGAGVSYLKVKNNWSQIDYDNFAGENLQQRLSEDSAQNHTFPAIILPVGVGLKYDISPKTSLRLEWVNRITFTDYLDGFSKAANPDKNDRYSSVMLSLNFAFGKNKASRNSQKNTTASYNNSNDKSENSMALANGNKQQSSSANTSNDNSSQSAGAENETIKELQAKLDLINRKLEEAQQKIDAKENTATNKNSNETEGNALINPANVEKYIIYFSFDHSYLEGESFNKLEQIATMMKADPKLNVTLNGYTDLKGSADYNMKLSSARALTCQDYLKSRGIDASRIRTEAFGKTRYVVGDLSKEQQWRNRRVEVYFN